MEELFSELLKIERHLQPKLLLLLRNPKAPPLLGLLFSLLVPRNVLKLPEVLAPPFHFVTGAGSRQNIQYNFQRILHSISRRCLPALFTENVAFPRPIPNFDVVGCYRK